MRGLGNNSLSESLYTEAYRGTWRKELGIFEGYAFTKAYQSPAKEIAVSSM